MRQSNMEEVSIKMSFTLLINTTNHGEEKDDSRNNARIFVSHFEGEKTPFWL